MVTKSPYPIDKGFDHTVVPGAGLEPARSKERGILNPLCLPISPPGQGSHRTDAWRRVVSVSEVGAIIISFVNFASNFFTIFFRVYRLLIITKHP